MFKLGGGYRQHIHLPREFRLFYAGEFANVMEATPLVHAVIYHHGSLFPRQIHSDPPPIRKLDHDDICRDRPALEQFIESGTHSLLGRHAQFSEIYILRACTELDLPDILLQFARMEAEPGIERQKARRTNPKHAVAAARVFG